MSSTFSIAGSTLSGLERHKAEFLLGPWLVGCYMDVFLQGVLFCQFQHYWDWYRDDKVWFKMGVAGLMLLTTLKTIQSFALIWIQSIEFVNDIDAAINLNYTVWWQTYNSLFVAIIGLYVQMYFSYRLLVICKSWYIVGLNGFLFAFGFIAQVIACIYIPTGDIPNTSLWFACHYSGVLAGDLLLTVLTIFFLIRSRRNVQSQGVSLITALIRLTFQSAAPAAVCALFNLIFSQVYSGNDALISAGFNQMLPKLYAISMMWTLNARRTIRAVTGNTSGGMSSSTGQDYSKAHSKFGGRSRRNTHQRENHELGNFPNSVGAIQVTTIQETVKHFDFDESPFPQKKTTSDSLISESPEYSPMRKGDGQV
ncbi:hypothetical protein CYLTODRAFT_491020 [Cylindrobasidium torrendii FP15055 ss-10]|uniref:DUF6534 domain-containing protein n=1 Tax=Cylindrobasidium torrendii FP15055 ss-10 TaxID=1314674 RepID=A0A0D7B8V7_9AGAR|nr:hypothetical protein CYLTODRAFT_491020 [Cylindrobasidium torrendii FP15055 ss-10]